MVYKDYKKILYDNHNEIFGDGQWSFVLKDALQPSSDNGIFKNRTMVKTYYRVVDEIEVRYSLPNTVERTSKKILMEYLKYKSNIKRSVTIGNEDTFIDTLVYYSYVINGINFKKPKSFHRELRRFIREKYSNVINSNMIRFRNSSYESVRLKAKYTKPTDDDILYRMTTIIDNYFRDKVIVRSGDVKYEVSLNPKLRTVDDVIEYVKNKYGVNNVEYKVKKLTTRTRSTILGSVILYFDEKGIVKFPQNSVFTNLGVAVNYSKKVLLDNIDYFENTMKFMDKSSKYMLVSAIVEFFVDKTNVIISKEKLTEFLGDEQLANKIIKEHYLKYLTSDD